MRVMLVAIRAAAGSSGRRVACCSPNASDMHVSLSACTAGQSVSEYAQREGQQGLGAAGRALRVSGRACACACRAVHACASPLSATPRPQGVEGRPCGWRRREVVAREKRGRDQQRVGRAGGQRVGRRSKGAGARGERGALRGRVAASRLRGAAALAGEPSSRGRHQQRASCGDRARVCVCVRARDTCSVMCAAESAGRNQARPGRMQPRAPVRSAALAPLRRRRRHKPPTNSRISPMAGLRQRRGVLAVDHVDRLEVTGLYCGQPTLVRACAHARRLWHALEPAPSEPRWRARTHMGVGAPR